MAGAFCCFRDGDGVLMQRGHAVFNGADTGVSPLRGDFGRDDDGVLLPGRVHVAKSEMRGFLASPRNDNQDLRCGELSLEVSRGRRWRGR